jgi:hypothetical protein
MSDNSASRFVPQLQLRRTVVVAEKATDAVTPPNEAAVMPTSNTLDQFVAEALMVAFAMVVDHELPERTTQMPLTQRNEVVQAFFLDRANKPLRVRIAVRGAKRCVRTTRTPDSWSRCRTAVLHFRSRSQIRKRCPASTPSVASVR